MTSFNEFCWDTLDQDPALMSNSAKAEAYKDYCGIKRRHKQSTTISDPSALAARETAKSKGGKALTGTTARQKTAGELIRAAVITKVNQEAATLLVSKPLYSTAKFWLNNKQKSPAEFQQFALQREEWLIAYQQAKNEGDASLVASIAIRYNELTSQWGFK